MWRIDAFRPLSPAPQACLHIFAGRCQQRPDINPLCRLHFQCSEGPFVMWASNRLAEGSPPLLGAQGPAPRAYLDTLYRARILHNSYVRNTK